MNKTNLKFHYYSDKLYKFEFDKHANQKYQLKNMEYNSYLTLSVVV